MHPLSTDRRRALELLADCPNGCTEATMLAYAIAPKTIVELVEAGLATADISWVHAGGRAVDVVRVRITDAGRR
jgi:hypothetical protein